MRAWCEKLLIWSLTILLISTVIPVYASIYKTPNGFKSQAFSAPNDYLPISECNLEEMMDPASPSNVYRSGLSPIDPKKSIRVLIYPIDFSDFRANVSEKLDFSELKSKLSDFYGSVSGGKVKFAWFQSKTYSRMSIPLSAYESNSRLNLNAIVRIIQDSQELAFKSFNSDDFDFFIAAPPPQTTVDEISTSVALLRSDKRFVNGTILAGDYWQSNQSWTLPAHELGHALGLLDLYNSKTADTDTNKVVNFYNQFEFMGFFDLMNWPTGPAPELLAWNRWQLGFMSENHVRCLPNVPTVTKLVPIESRKDGIKALFMKLDSSRILILENRTSIGFDRQLPKWASGVLVYLVDLNIKTGDGPIKIVKNHSADSSKIFTQALQNGESTFYNGILIENLSNSNAQILVRVSKS